MRLARGFAAGALLIALAASARAAQVPSVVHVNVSNEVDVDFELAGIDAVGFTHRPRTSKERDAANAAAETLRMAADWIRFNSEAQCRPSVSSIAANLYRAIDPEAPKSAPPLTKPAFDAHFTFTCDAMPALRTLNLRLIEQFPRVHEVIVDVRTPALHHAEIVTTPSGTVSLAPK